MPIFPLHINHVLPYPVCFGEESWTEPWFRELCRDSRIFILTDRHTDAFCYPQMEKRVPELNAAPRLAIQPGERSKNIHTLQEIWAWLSATGAARDAVLVNLGGGVVTDLGGFAAGTYMRGIRYVNIPTSLIGQVDAAIGGKTGINLEQVKNQAGLFYDPQGVIIDSAFLRTLPERHFRSGMAEIIKCAALAGGTEWERVVAETGPDISRWVSFIMPSAAFKCSVVAGDPLEKGYRKVLNFGHTIGHAMETLSLRGEAGSHLHGEAVAAGMICEGILSNRLRGFPARRLEELASVILRHFRPVPVASGLERELLEITGRDKKIKGGVTGFSLLEDTGRPVHDVACPEETILEAIAAFNRMVA